MFFDYEEQAKNHEPVPEELSMFDECGYRILSDIYVLYQRGSITKEQAIDKKRKLKARALKEIQLDNFRDNTAYEREKFYGCQSRHVLRREKSLHRKIALH